MFTVGKLCGQFGTEAVYVGGFLKKVIYCGLLFFLSENHHNIEEELGERTEERKRDPLTGEGRPNEPAQGRPAGTAVSQGKCLLQVGLLVHVTVGLSQDLVNETCDCAYNNCKMNFRALLIRNN
jgi:hypothetical protein